MGGGSTTYPAKVPAFVTDIGNQYAEFLRGTVGTGGIPASPYDLSQPSTLQRQAWSGMEQFGATGMQPFTNALTRLAETGGMDNYDSILYDIAARDMSRRSDELRSQAGSLGLGSSSGLGAAMAGAQRDIYLGLGQQRASLQSDALNRQLAAAQAGMTAIPGVYGAMANMGGQQQALTDRAYQDWWNRRIAGPAQLFGTGSGMGNVNWPQNTVVQQPDQWGTVASIVGALIAAFAS